MPCADKPVMGELNEDIKGPLRNEINKSIHRMVTLGNIAFHAMAQLRPMPMPRGLVFFFIGMGLIVISVCIYFIYRFFITRVEYDLDGTYGGGRGFRTVYRHKKLKRVDREAAMRGSVRTFKDAVIEKLLYEERVSEAAQHLTGLLNVAKEQGDKFTLKRYSAYTKELFGMYDKMEEDDRGGKAVHIKK